MEKMGISDQDSHLAVIAAVFAHQGDIYWGQSSRSVAVVPAPGRGGEETQIPSSPQFLVRVWSGTCPSPETHPQSSSRCWGQGEV